MRKLLKRTKRQQMARKYVEPNVRHPHHELLFPHFLLSCEWLLLFLRHFKSEESAGRNKQKPNQANVCMHLRSIGLSHLYLQCWHVPNIAIQRNCTHKTQIMWIMLKHCIRVSSKHGVQRIFSRSTLVHSFLSLTHPLCRSLIRLPSAFAHFQYARTHKLVLRWALHKKCIHIWSNNNNYFINCAER